MPRRTIPLIMMLAILATLVLPAGRAEAKWVTASELAYGDVVACRDGLSLGVGRSPSDLGPQTNIITEGTLLPSKTPVLSQPVTTYKAESTMTISGTPAIGYIGFPMLQWSNGQELLVGDMVQLVGLIPHILTVQDCRLVLDSFKLRQGQTGETNWSGQVSGYQYTFGQLHATTGGPLYWRRAVFGVDQEAWMRLATVGSNTGSTAAQGLLLKVQSNNGTPDWQLGAIKIVYQTNQGCSCRPGISVQTHLPGTSGWTEVGSMNGVVLNNNDILQARVSGNDVYVIQSATPPMANGTEGTRTGKLIGRITLKNPDAAFFTGKGGQAGLWFQNAPTAVVQSFGGGTISANNPVSCSQVCYQ